MAVTSTRIRIGLACLIAALILFSVWVSVPYFQERACNRKPAACLDTATGIMREIPGLSGGPPRIPCRFVGKWLSVGRLGKFEITLFDDGSYFMEPNQHTQWNRRGGYTGYWMVQGESMVWRHNSPEYAGQADINPILLDEEESFTLLEQSGDHVRFELIEPASSRSCS